METRADIEGIVSRLRSSSLIREKTFGNISSFNFSHGAYYSGKWDDLTLRARGLFIDTNKSKIVARGYDKFFNVGEIQSTKLPELKSSIAFPVTAYRKENGFLGILGYDRAKDDFLFATKSMVSGEFADNFRRILLSSGVDMERLRNVIKNFNVTLLFEVIDPVRDPHIIKYDTEHVVLLDAVYNEWDFHKIPYSTLQGISILSGIQCKRKAVTLRDWKEFVHLITSCDNENYKDPSGDFVEGYVLEDQNGFMVKVKTRYYLDWKYYRQLVFGNRGIGNVGTDEFLSWCREELRKGEIDAVTNIIELRDLFYQSKGVSE